MMNMKQFKYEADVPLDFFLEFCIMCFICFASKLTGQPRGDYSFLCVKYKGTEKSPRHWQPHFILKFGLGVSSNSTTKKIYQWTGLHYSEIYYYYLKQIRRSDCFKITFLFGYCDARVSVVSIV
jgi:hypothetical protein